MSDNEYGKPVNPVMSILTEAYMGMIISCDMNEPDEDAAVELVTALIGIIFKAGAPREIRGSDVIVEAELE